MYESNARTIAQESAQLASHMIQGVLFSNLCFAIMHGNGNVILVVDEEHSRLERDQINRAFACELCELFTTIKIDGVAFLDASTRPLKMTFFDRDGTPEPMCGNGLRCSTRYASDRGYIQAVDAILTDDGSKWVSASYDHVEVSLGPGREFAVLDERTYFAFTSVAHLVIISEQIDTIAVAREGARHRYDMALCTRLAHPDGVHVNYLEPLGEAVYVRTYEVGVEDETLSCGSGAAASAYIAHQVLNYVYPVTVRTRGGDIIVHERPDGLTIRGVVEYVYTSF